MASHNYYYAPVNYHYAPEEPKTRTATAQIDYGGLSTYVLAESMCNESRIKGPPAWLFKFFDELNN